MRRHILCLGDSNTHGYCADPADCADSALFRFNEEERWTCLLQKALGEQYLVIEEGLSGRTTVFDDPVEEGLSALPYLRPCLKSHRAISLLVIMLGTNDAKSRLGANAHAIGRGMERLVQAAQRVDCWGPGGRPNILIIAPKAIEEAVYTSPVADEMGPGCVEKTRQLAAEYEEVSRRNGCAFLDANTLDLACNGVDFMHLTRESHARLAAALARIIPTLM